MFYFTLTMREIQLYASKTTRINILYAYCVKIVVFDTSTKVLILARVLGLSPERIESNNDTSVESSFSRVSNNIFRYGGVKAILKIRKMRKVALYIY